jgi:hypothetical protein
MQDNPPLVYVGEILSAKTQWKFKQKNDLADERDMKVYAFRFTSPIQHCKLCTFLCIYMPTTEVNII